jgi:hypothetical protein
MKPHSLRALAALASAFSLVLACDAAHAAKVTGDWTPIFQGVDSLSAYETDVHYAGESGTRRLAVNAVRIDLKAPGLSFYSTPDNGAAPMETRSETTGSFLESHGLQVAINANFFSPCCSTTPENKDLSGLAISQGTVVSPAEAGRTSLALTQANQAVIAAFGPGSDVSSFYTAVTGGDRLLNGGAIGVSAVPPDAFSDKNPRTAVGLSADKSSLLLVTIDGRQPGYSDGATLYETADWLRTLGAYDALNLDGGGSTNLVMADPNGKARYLNQVSDGRPRLDGNSFGVFAQPLAAVPEPSTLALFGVGIGVLLWTARRGRS